MSDKRHVWRCCGHMLRSEFCPRCGALRPAVLVSGEAEELADEFAGISDSAAKAAETRRLQAEQIVATKDLNRAVWVPCDMSEQEHIDHGGDTWMHRARAHLSMADGLQRRADTFARYSRILRGMIDMLHEMTKDAR